MPRIGSGQAGGSWTIISELIETEVCAAGVPVTVYDLPGRKDEPEEAPQRNLFSV